jgi:hypothetical protein
MAVQGLVVTFISAIYFRCSRNPFGVDKTRLQLPKKAEE